MSGYSMSRRDFLILSSIGITGALMPLDALGSQIFYRPDLHVSKWNREVRVIDPPPSGLLKDPLEIPNLSAKAGIVDVMLDVKKAPVDINGKRVNLLTYSGAFPAKTIRIKQGDRLKVTLKNSLPPTDEKTILGYTKNITNLHVHGWSVSPSGNSDNVFVAVNPGKEFVYEYDTSKQEAGTFGFYHPHYHGLVAEQIWSGLAGGALIVEDNVKILSDFETHILVLKDFNFIGSEPASYTEQDYLYGKEGDIVLINSQINPVLNVRPGQVQRWRFVNEGPARYYKLSLEGHKLYVIGTDGGLLDRPYPVSELLLSPGERVDLLMTADNTSGTYKLLSLPYNRQGNELQKVTLMTIVYKGESAKDKIPSVINPDAKRLAIDINTLPRRKLYLIMANGRSFINLKDFNEDPHVITSKVGTYEVWEIINISPMDHPFHQHINAAQVLSIKGGDAAYAEFYSSIPAWKDTINVPFQGVVTMLVPVMNFTGKTLYHCHILEHEETGMMGVWEIV